MSVPRFHAAYSRPLFSSRRLVRADDDKPLIRRRQNCRQNCRKGSAGRSYDTRLCRCGGQHIVTRPSPARLRSARPTNRTRSLAWTASRRPPASLPSTCPRSRKTQLLSHASFTWLTSRRTEGEDRPITFSITRSGQLDVCCTWARSAQSTWSQRRPALARRAYKLVTTPTRCSTPATWFHRHARTASTAHRQGRGKAFWGVDEDANAYARFIARSSRSTAAELAKFILARATELRAPPSWQHPGEPHQYRPERRNSVIAIFNFTTDIDFPRGNPGVDLPYVMALPTYAATAWYHKKLPSNRPRSNPF